MCNRSTVTYSICIKKKIKRTKPKALERSVETNLHPSSKPTTFFTPTGRGGYQQRQNNHHNDNSFEPCQPSFTKRPGVSSWSDLKRRWRDETTITIEDEEPAVLEPPTTATARTTGAAAAAAATGTDSSSEVQVVQESVSPLISSPGGITSMAGVYERLRVIRSATDRTIRARRVDYALSYEVFSATTRNFRKASPGNPMCRIFVVKYVEHAFGWGLCVVGFLDLGGGLIRI